MGKIKPLKVLSNIIPGARIVSGLIGGGGGGDSSADAQARAAAEQQLAAQKASEEQRFRDEQLRLQQASNEEIGRRSTALSAFFARHRDDPNFGGNKFAGRQKRVSIFDNI